ncbi:MAG TPA: hypothetical protein VFE45_18835 [Coriobacteriia bacterium]|nr:hypothetical protein [Coriobacteriia bacterium]
MGVLPDPHVMPHCRVTSQYADGSSDDPAIYDIWDLRGDWGSSRKEFLKSCATLTVLGLCGCGIIGYAVESCDDNSDKPSSRGESTATVEPTETVAPIEDEEPEAPEEPDTGDGTTPRYGGGTYCQCDTICTCIPIV